MRLKTHKAFTSFFILLLLAGCLTAQDPARPNFIFIVVDDLNDYPEPFTNDMPQVNTPHINQLADSGTVFINAFSSAVGCAPSRTSFLSGKDLSYTKVYNNGDYNNSFRLNFNAERDNEFVVTLPEILKDSGGYFTYAINKIYHNPSSNDFDNSENEECEKIKSWNRMLDFDPADSSELFDPVVEEYSFDKNFPWGPIPDSLSYLLSDLIAADTAVQFIHNYVTGVEPACGRPFFLAVGFKYPHADRLVPESYFMDDYVSDIYAEPFDPPYNDPKGAYPYNGVIMPPQPDTMYEDLFHLPENGIASVFAEIGSFYTSVSNYYDSLDVKPEFDPAYDDSTRKYVLEETVKANYLLAYLAAIEYVDEQIGRVLAELYANPELAQNTIIILISDHGFALGEKRHWEKWCLWETDIRIPMIIADPSRPGGQVVEKAVSLLDIYPTVCELAGVELPQFTDGTIYPDGRSLVDLLDDPSTDFERPALSTYKKNAGIASCFPSISVRNERFHYIIYRHNNDGSFGVNYCDSTYFGFEEELYEIGAQRETDPYEWNNLINDPDYAPVVNFMQQFLPDSNLYLSSTYKAIIQNEPVNCFLAADDTLNLSLTWLDTLGNEIAPSPSFTYKWTTNLTDEAYLGTELNFPVELIDGTDFETEDQLIIYLQVYDTSNQLIAFDIKNFYINNANEPVATFNVNFDSLETATVTDFSITGSYTSFEWDFGSGIMFRNEIPGPYTYPAPGIHTVTLYVHYGNDCVKTYTVDNFVTTTDLTPGPALAIAPNPADHSVTVSLPDNALQISIYDPSGRLIWQSAVEKQASATITIPTTTFKTGIYMVRVNCTTAILSSSFIIMH